MRNRSGVGRTVAIVTLASVVVVACGGGGEPDGLASGGNYSVFGAVSEIPPDVVGEDILIYTGDLTAASEARGVERPEDLDDVSDWLIEITAGSARVLDADPQVFVPLDEFSSAGAFTSEFEEFADAVGYSILDVDAFVELSTPPDRFAVVSGEFDGDSLSGDLEDLGDGVLSHGSGDDFESDLEQTSAVSRLGMPTRLAEDDGRIAMSPSTPAVEAWLAGDGEVPTDSISDIADRLDDADVYAAALQASDGFAAAGAIGGRLTGPAVEALLEEDWIPPAPFHAIGLGWAVDGDEAVVTVVVAHDDDAGADDNAAAFELMFDEGESIQGGRPLDDLYDLQEVSLDGDTVVLTLHLRPDVPASVIHQALLQRDTPFVHT